MALKFFMSVAKWLKLKVRKIWGLIFTFVEVTGEKLVGGLFAPPPPFSIGLRVTLKLKIATDDRKRLLSLRPTCVPLMTAWFASKKHRKSEKKNRTEEKRKTNMSFPHDVKLN